jgi:hypothetical protein
MRLVNNTEPLLLSLKNLGFKEIGKGKDLIRRFQKGNRYVYMTNRGLFLLVEFSGTIKDKKMVMDGHLIQYRGLTIYSTLLEFFADPKNGTMVYSTRTGVYYLK